MVPRAITGMGVCCTAGIGRDAFFDALRAPVALADRGPRPVVESFDASAYPGAAVAEVPSFDASAYLGDKGLRTLDRLTKLLVVAARLASHDAGLKLNGAFAAASPERVGIVCSNAYGSLEAMTELNRVAKLEDARYINPAKFPNTVANSASGYASIWEDLRALNVAISDGNCGALDAVACADIYLDNLRADALLVGGAESLSEAIFLAFQRLGALEAGAWIGEGACLMVMEEREHAKKRGAKVLADVVGCGTAFEAPEAEGRTMHVSSEALRRAIAQSLEDAAVSPAEVDLVVSGVAGLKVLDQEELGGIAKALGRSVPVFAPKKFLGETLGAGGAFGMAAAIGWLQGIKAPVIEGDEPANVKTVLVTAMGYYGNASAVLLRAA